MEEKIKKAKKKSKLKKKIVKFFLFLVIILIAISAVANNYIGDNRSIYIKIGSMEPASVSIKDALTKKGYAIMPYADYLKAGDTKSAYDMLSKEYKKTVSYDEYLKTIEDINFETFDMKQIKLKAEGTYVATVVYEENGEKKETDYLLYSNEINPNIITISPNKFICNFSNLKFKMDNVEFKINNCNIYTDNIKLNLTLKNTSLFDTATFTNIGVGYGENTSKTQNMEVILKAGESKELELEYETNYYVPNNLKVKRLMDENTLRTYTFYFEKSK